MKILVDENIPKMTVSKLVEMGHDVADVRGAPQEGISDAVLWERARLEQRLLVTTDKGFAARRDEPYSGILIVRLRQPNRERIRSRVLQAIESMSPADRPGMLLVVRDSVRSFWKQPDLPG